MEEGEKGDMSTSGGGPTSSRWTPTKEQISMLESLYKQGIRTPSAEQIQQITSRLKVYGHIEGKNVFYWFQNHKARQRQKQKQENMAYFMTHYLHNNTTTTPPVFPPPPPPCPNVVCSPYYIGHGDLGLYPQYHKVLGGMKRRSPKTKKVENNNICDGHTHVGYEQTALMINNVDNGNSNQETLALFPLEPTGILQARSIASSSNFVSTSSVNHSTTPSSSSETTGIEEGSGHHQPFIDFFSGGNRSCESTD